MDKLLHKLKLLLSIVLSWFSVDCLHDNECIQKLLKMCLKLWPIISTNSEVQIVYMRMLLHLSHNSLPGSIQFTTTARRQVSLTGAIFFFFLLRTVCKAIATVSHGAGQSMTLLQLLIKYCVNETAKVKSPQTNFIVLELALQVISNCCACIECRLMIIKVNVRFTHILCALLNVIIIYNRFQMNMLDSLSRLHPLVTRSQKPWPQITHSWLQFYEVLTRHADDASKVR